MDNYVSTPIPYLGYFVSTLLHRP